MILILRGAAFALTLSASAFIAPEEGASLGGYICAAPFPPACAREMTSASPAGELADCQVKIDAFIAETRAYRNCLQLKISDALRTANEIADAFTCRTHKVGCPGAAPRR